MDFGLKLSTLLKHIGKTQKDFSTIINIQPAVLSRYINNKTVPSIDFIQSLKIAIPNLNLNWLLASDKNILLKDIPSKSKVIIKNGERFVGLVEDGGVVFLETPTEIKNEFLDSFNKLYKDTIDNNLEEFFKIQFKKFECIMEEEIYNSKKV